MIADLLRPLRRDPIYVGSSIMALAVGLAAAIFAFLYVRDELSFDRFIPGHERVGVLIEDVSSQAQAHITTDSTSGSIAAKLKAAVPGVGEVSRLAYDNLSVRHGDLEARESAVWVDPNFFDVLRLPRVAGDPGLAMRSPDGVVLTRALAARYFPAGRALGAIVQIDGVHAARVMAVIEDIPAASHLAGLGVFLSGRSPYSLLSRQQPNDFINAVVDMKPQAQVRFVRERTYVRLASGFSFQGVGAGLARFAKADARQLAPVQGTRAGLSLAPIAKLHTYPFRGATIGASDPHADPTSLADLAVLGALILLLAVTHFVNLATARAARRAREIGVRKALGASRADLMRLFFGEVLAQVLIAAALAVSLVELSLPAVNAFLMKDMAFAYWRDPLVAAALLVTIAAVTLLAGGYPAAVLASFRPSRSLRGADGAGGGSAAVRQGLVAFQFAVLLVLLLGAAVVWSQARYATNEGLRLDKDGVLVVSVSPCRGAFAEEVRRLPGVRSSGCGQRAMLGLDDFDPVVTDGALQMAGHPTATVALGMADFGLFETLGIRPLAGRLFETGHAASDALPPYHGQARQAGVVLNETAARGLGFSNPGRIVGKVVLAPRQHAEPDHWTVLGVVPDFTLDLRSAAVKPTAYIIDPGYPFEQVLAVRLEGRRIPETLAAIRRLWPASGHAGAPRIQFLDDYVQRLYLATTRQAVLLSALCLVAAGLACVGLLALAAYTAQRRTKEIGVRKAMGASAVDVVRLLLLQFSRPVALGILAGMPIAYLAARRWLEGFSYHIALQPWLFALAAMVALLIGLGAGLFHALAVARAQPVKALRYE